MRAIIPHDQILPLGLRLPDGYSRPFPGAGLESHGRVHNKHMERGGPKRQLASGSMPGEFHAGTHPITLFNSHVWLHSQNDRAFVCTCKQQRPLQRQIYTLHQGKRPVNNNNTYSLWYTYLTRRSRVTHPPTTPHPRMKWTPKGLPARGHEVPIRQTSKFGLRSTHLAQSRWRCLSWSQWCSYTPTPFPSFSCTIRSSQISLFEFGLIV